MESKQSVESRLNLTLVYAAREGRAGLGMASRAGITTPKTFVLWESACAVRDSDLAMRELVIERRRDMRDTYRC